MARGWESKSVEDQIEAAESRRVARIDKQLNAVEDAKAREREQLQLSRTRVLHDIEHANNPRYQDILRGALKHLDDKLIELG
jgi:molecular chaperone GrpE (heat shock protein)